MINLLRPILSFFFCASLLGVLLSNASPLQAQEEYRLRKISFNGNRTFSGRTLSENMITKGPSAWKRWLLGKSSEYGELMLQQDLKSLVAFYQREGFIDVQINRQTERNDKDKTVTITIQVREGEPVRIDHINYYFANDSSGKKYLQKLFSEQRGKLKLNSGQRFRDDGIQQDKTALTAALSNNGYLYAQVTVKPVLRAAERRADLSFNIVQGPLCRFGRVSVSGNSRTDSSLIVEQVAFKHGDLFSQEVLQRSQRFVYQLGVFQYVTIKVNTGESHNQVLPVELLVKEAPRVTTKLGVGYGREEFLRVFVDLRFLNVLGGGRRINLYAKHSRLEPYNLLLRLTQPAFFHPGASLSLNPFYRSEKEPGFAIVRYGTDFSYQQRLSYYTDGSIGYTFERDRLSVSRMTIAEALKNQSIKLYKKSSVTISLVNDRSYPIFQPQRGWYNAATLTLTGVGLQSDFHFMRWIFESRKYTKLLEGYVLAARIKIGSMKPLYEDTVTPIEERFYSGGSNSVRGWGRSQLGPKSSADAPVGGNSLTEASVEMRYPLYKLLQGVVFYDIGNVWNSYLTFPLSELRYAAGAGLRFQTPIGPIRLDVAWPLGEGKRPLQLHISIGQAF
jgi:outer membrane protein insertion porin family